MLKNQEKYGAIDAPYFEECYEAGLQTEAYDRWKSGIS